MTLRSTALVLTLLVLPGAPPAAAADRAEALYTRALARERVVRDADRQPTLKQIRSSIAEYERIVRRFPRSGYSDNALWQAGQLALFAHERFGQAADRAAAVRLLSQLKSNYPSSSLVRAVADALRRTDTIAALATPPRAPSPPVAPTKAEKVEKAEEHAAAATSTAVGPLTLPPGPPVLTSGGGTKATIRNITRTPLPDGLRVSIELDGEAAYRSERLAGPDRVFFDLKGASTVSTLQDATLRYQDDIVREIRLGRHPQHTTRIVMDMAGVDSYSVFTLYEPFRLVIDFKAAAGSGTPASAKPAAAAPPIAPLVRPAPAAAPMATTGVVLPPAPAAASTLEDAPPEETTAGGVKPLPSRRAVPPALNPPALPSVNADGKFSLARQLGLGLSRIVIDAGHGGHDPGSQGNGLKEADLALDVAQRLKKLLEKQTPIEVVMTRDSDVFIPLEERTAIANREGADLFLSIHANTARNPQARGIETYFLNFTSNPDAEAVAARENSTSGRSMHSLPDIVRAITLNNKIDESRDFATAVQKSMVQRLSTRNKQVKDRGVKQAPFVVLIGAAMPSVLAEISFLTNKPEAKLLKTGAYRQQIAEALLDAVLRYQQSLKRMKQSTANVGTR